MHVLPVLEAENPISCLSDAFFSASRIAGNHFCSRHLPPTTLTQCSLLCESYSAGVRYLPHQVSNSDNFFLTSEMCNDPVPNMAHSYISGIGLEHIFLEKSSKSIYRICVPCIFILHHTCWTDFSLKFLKC